MSVAPIRFTVPGKPVAKGRAQASVIAGHVRMRTPAKTVAYESTVALVASQAMQGRELMEGPLRLSVVAYFPMAKSWPKKKVEAARRGEVLPTSRPDADNVAKAIADACNGICYADDAAIVSLAVVKAFADVPRVEVVIRPARVVL